MIIGGDLSISCIVVARKRGVATMCANDADLEEYLLIRSFSLHNLERRDSYALWGQFRVTGKEYQSRTQNAVAGSVLYLCYLGDRSN